MKKTSWKKRMIYTIVGMVALMMLAMIGMMAMMVMNVQKATRGGDAFAKNNPALVPTFKEIKANFNHIHGGHIAQPVLDLILFDPCGDGTQAIAVTGGEGQHDAVLLYKDGNFTNITKGLGLEVRKDDISYSMVADDIDGDGAQELIVGRQSGVYVYSRQPAGGTFLETKIDLALPQDAVPAGLATSDTTKSGLPDIFVSTFIDHRKHSTANFHDPAKRVSNVFWKNNGDGTFSDASKESGLALHHNTFLAKFADLNGNGYDDLVLGTNTSEGFVFENMKDGTFKEHKLPIGYGFWMGLTVADLTGNGQPDIYLSNAGTAVPRILMKGDLKKGETLDTSYRVLENDGNFGFTDVTKKLGLDSPSFGWGMEVADFLNNGENQIVVTENFIGMPMNIQKYIPSKGALFVKGPDGKYQNTVIPSGLVNKNFGYRALAIDLDGNGFKDLLIANVNGPLRAFMNQGK